MAEQQEAPVPDQDEIVEILGEIAERSRTLVEDFLNRQRHEVDGRGIDPMQLGSTFFELTARLMRDPTDFVQAQFDLWQNYIRLWQTTAQRMMGQEPEPVIVPERGDRRFKDAAWNESALFDFIKQSYLLASRFLLERARNSGATDDKQSQKIEFYTRQFVDALAPSNFVMTNPEVLRLTVETRGENLLRGLKNMLEDLERGKGRLAIKMTDLDAFEIGRNIATTPGQVVFQNDLMQLIQYQPTTPQVHKRPLMIMPPWINKFYILDLQPRNSFIKFAVDKGFTVFVLSWVNPDERLAHKSFEDYMVEGPLAALDAIRAATGEKDVNAIGYCLGGTLLACTLSWMAAKRDNRIKAATFFTSLVDFKDPGELGVFIDEEQLAAIEATMAKRGYLDGAEMSTTFNLLRANDLIWSFVINNYLMGKDPFPFDLLYWNSDNTRMPAAMHGFYLRRFYHENRLMQPGGICMKDVPVDLGRLRLPVYWVSTREDHIAPWKSTYSATQIYKGQKRFVLAGSGHIAGIVNPPASGKYGYWTNDELPPDAEEWLAGATHHEGSWWNDWAAWNAERSGAMVDARVPGAGGLPALEPAPGSYVKVRAG
ncbi:MAG TPA: class I poly(R)-hydroxyalkanoic acid synthase [Geminicoccaceae bacterium]|nr:class I poly(R)-hydroxyalkanoic acid synthase [Geminicoccus sp.]HMU49214.1 class I poly(R)-hydroxyalkanoic acid synthase [Geminicoccaceae bacterium]